jgi:predicted phosphodiesterase
MHNLIAQGAVWLLQPVLACPAPPAAQAANDTLPHSFNRQQENPLMTRRPQGEKLFTVGLISDTHCNEREDFSASPYPANAEANARARYAFACLEREQPAFVIHLGDMVNPVPELPTYGAAVAEFNALAGMLSVPLHLVPGNHDIGDKPVGWMPAGTIDETSIATYEAAFGRHYYSLRHADIRFIVLNAALINSGLPQEANQRAWLEAEFAGDPSVRTFVFIHYPLFVSDPDEPGSYDNLEEPGRSWLMALVKKYRPEALFAAHVHNFWYNVIGATETYVLPSTCFVRHDYSEMFRIDAGDQYGRNDAAKLGFAVLDIYETGHVVHYQRSYGATLAPGQELPSETPALGRINTRTSSIENLMVDMRRSWAEELDIAPSGAVDEFGRKRARNDYPVMALWETGLRAMRVPIQDLLDPRVRQRMVLMAAVGHCFQVYCYGCPDQNLTNALARHADLVAVLEVVINWEDALAAFAALRKLHNETGLTICLSRVNRKDAAKFGGNRYNHLISHGFSMAEVGELAGALEKLDPDGSVAQIMFTVPREVCPWRAVIDAESAAHTLGRRVTLYVKSSGASPAEAFVDENANAARFLTAALAALADRDTTIILDTFTDADRGYFVRTGLVDRRYNPRRAGQLVRDLMTAANGKTWQWVGDGGNTPKIAATDGTWLQLTVDKNGAPRLTAGNGG